MINDTSPIYNIRNKVELHSLLSIEVEHHFKRSTVKLNI